MLPSRHLRASLAAALLATAGGGIAAGRAAGETALDPCALFTQAEAEQVLGGKVVQRHDQEVGFSPGTICSYDTVASPDQVGGAYGASLELYDAVVFAQQGSYFASPEQYFHRNREAQGATPPGVEDIAGVGEAAFWLPAPGQLHVLDHGVYLVLSVHANFHIPPGPSDQVDAEERAAETKAAKQLATGVVLPALETLR
ncbi:hypothetical protein SAMN06265365_13942 [Tistlia consotensis]|uniref:Uncharacterized protein n=1 Tax=Tistlia consotensis USBA 355 TaxID=560819 RepID=A0A1Y6CVI0_9PROT|nr:hypothetical protein [Tistlia consotensis]SMF81020.1 hypothetical protein SAMN05428998_14242 [Tistlia consotensis USBA 355]SNS22370.1 hypothetical protein SAMN06265365_13942 [Tistlia consotensis]